MSLNSTKTDSILEDIKRLTHPTPFFMFIPEAVLSNLANYKQQLPLGTEICYAMKANSEELLLDLLVKQDISFEVASVYELRMLKERGVTGDRIIFGTSVKPAAAIAEFHEYGVSRYGFDSKDELIKIAANAPDAKVYVRVLVEDKADSVFTMSEKFGINVNTAVDLLEQAKSLNLEPYGVSFNVGSQARNVNSWANALLDIKKMLHTLEGKGLKPQIVNLGGGFPYSYQDNDSIPSIESIGQSISDAIKDLPYPVQFLAEPGRGLVADAFVLVTSVFAKNKRTNGHWLYLDAGAYNALLEAMSYQGSIKYKVSLTRESSAPLEPYILTGPTGDSLDVIGREIMIPNDVNVGDSLVVFDAGAYSLTLMTPFNGFPKPEVWSNNT